ncbi:MAG: hypothetical protein GTO02_21385 [Candidatus Dadabacteria bacterium]|nr:hypothetical protein [Candidatus Dadabacteria bacterium]
MRTLLGGILCLSLFAIGCGDGGKLEQQIDELSTQNQQLTDSLTKNQESITSYKESTLEEVRKKHQEAMAENLSLSREIDLARKEIKDLQAQLAKNEKVMKGTVDKAKALEKQVTKNRIRLFGR